MTTIQYTAKRAILDLLEESARSGLLATQGADGGPLQIKRDARPSGMEERCLYAGGTREERLPENRLVEGNSSAQGVSAYSTWFIRVRGATDVGEPGKEIQTLEEICESIGSVFEQLITDNAQLAGPQTDSYVSVSQADHDWEDVSNTTLLMYEVRTDALIQ